MRKKKKDLSFLWVIAGGFSIVLFLVIAIRFTELPNLYFEGKPLPVDQIEEILEDRLENENGIDLEVTITKDSDDKGAK